MVHGCDPATEHFGIGVGTIVLTLNVLFLALHFRLPFAAAFDRRFFGFKIQSAVVRESLQLRELPQHTAT